jgi:hypothetical protein
MRPCGYLLRLGWSKHEPQTPHSLAFDIVTFEEATLLRVAGKTGPLEHAKAFHKRTTGAETNGGHRAGAACPLGRLGQSAGNRLNWPLLAGRHVCRRHRLLPCRVRCRPEHMRAPINDLATRADRVLRGLEEDRFLMGGTKPEGIARFYRWLGAQLVIVKFESDIANFEDASNCGHVPGFSVALVIARVRAGDGFAGGVISAVLDGLGAAPTVTHGAWIVARAMQVPGNSEGPPNTYRNGCGRALKLRPRTEHL